MNICHNVKYKLGVATGIFLVAFLLFTDAAFSQSNLDAGLVKLVQPVGTARTGATRSISVRVRNFGGLAITKLRIQWWVNNTLQTEYYNTISPSIAASSNTDQMPYRDIVLSSSYLDVVGNAIKVVIADVNDQTDINPLNDTLRITLGSPISGNKVIGIGGDYRTFAEAVNAMRYNGVSGDLSFAIKSGSYTNDNIDLVASEIYFSNGSKKIRFESQTGKRDVILISEAAQQVTVKLTAIDNVTIKNIRVINRNIVTGIGVQLLTSADNNTIDNCEITVDSISNAKAFIGLLTGTLGAGPSYGLSTNAAAKYLSITNSKFSGGYYNIAVSGASSPRDTGLVIENNTLQQSSYYGVYVNYSTNSKISKNKVSFRPSADLKSAGFYLQNISTSAPGNIQITRNYVTSAGQYGIYLNNVSGTGAPTNRYVNIYNNMIAGGFYNNYSNASYSAAETPTGILMNGCGWANVYFNSVNMDAPTKSGFVDNTTAFYVNGVISSGSIRVFNNVFSNENKGYAYYNNSISASNPVTLSDNNDLYVQNLDTNNNPIAGFAYWNGAVRTSLRDLVSSSGSTPSTQLHKATFSKDPMFFSSIDLHTLSTDLNQKGSTYPLSEVPIDYDNELRDQTNNPDVGCDEFGPGGRDFAIIGVTPDVFRFNKPTTWKVTVRYQGDGSGNGTLYFLYKIDGVDQITNIDSAIGVTATGLNGNMKSQSFTIPSRHNILRTNYQPFKLTVYFLPGSNTNDLRDANDSIVVDICVGLEGTFSINPKIAPSITNFTSFQEVYDYLKCGVSGPTTFEIADGTYDEQINLWKIRNSSTTNNITFKSQNNVYSTKLTYKNGTAENHSTVLFNNAQYITLRDLTIENRSTGNGSCIQLAGNSKYNIIRNNIIKIDSTLNPYPTPLTIGGTLIPIIASRLGTLITANSYATNAENNTIQNNSIFGGYYGILFYGQDADKRSLGNVISGNTITSFHKSGIYLEYSDTKVLNNTIVGKFGMDNNAYAIYAKSLGEPAGVALNEISGNRIFDIPYQGIFLEKCSGKKVTGAKRSSFVLSNNMIGGGFTTIGSLTSGLFFKSCAGISILHNTVNMDAPRAATTTYSTAVARCMIVDSTNADLEAVNNIFYSANGAICMEYYTKLSTGTVKTGLSYSEANLYFTKYKSLNTPLILIQRWSNTKNSPKVETQYGFSQLSQTPLSALTNFKKGNGNTSRDRKSIALSMAFEELPYDLHTYDLTVESKALGGQDIVDDFDKQARKSKNPDIGCDEFTVPNYDLDLNKIMNPLFSALKPNKIVVKLRNRGRYPLENLTVALKYTVSDLEHGFSITGKDTVTLKMKKTGDSQIYTFKNRVSLPSRGNYTVCVEKVVGWIIQDTVFVNDKICKDVCTGIEGNYYIGFDTKNPIPGTDTLRYFNKIQEAFDGVVCGIADDTWFNINPVNSPYTERITIPKYLVNLDSPLLTLQPYNTISNTAVRIQQPTGGDINNIHYTVRFNGSNFVRLLNLNILNSSVSYGSGVHFTRNSVNNIVEGCKIEVNSALTLKVFYPIAFTSTNKLDITDNNSFAKNGSANRIVRNTIIGGYAGIAMLGASSVEYDEENILDSNIIQDYYQYGIYSANNTIKRIGFNQLTPRVSSATTCVSISYNFAGEGGIINANRIINSKQIGIKLYGIDGFTNNRMIVSNNWITHSFGNSIADTASAILIKRSNNIGIYYNSIRYNGLISALNFAKDSAIIPGVGGEPDQKIYFTPTNIQVRNNIVMVDSILGARKPYAVYFNSSDPSSEFEHNAYYTGYPSKFAFYSPRDQRSFAIWQLNTAKDLTSYSVPKPQADTLFMSGLNLNLRDTTIFDKKGIVVQGISRDYNNRKRSPRVTDIGSIEYERQNLDLSILDIINKKAIYGSNSFSVTLLNDGNSDLSNSSVQLEYSLDSGKTWIGRETVNLTSLKGRYDEQVFTFSLKHQKNNFLVIPLCVRLATRITGDTTFRYESICKDLCVGLEKGIYTIGKNGTEDFPDFQQAVVALICGFDSSIVFKVSPGTYNERFSIPDVKTGADTTVTFESATGRAKDVTIQYTNTIELLEHHVVQLDGSKYIKFKNLTFASQAKARASGIHIADSARFITVENCIFRFDTTSNINTLVGILASSKIAYTDPAQASYNTIKNCEFYGGAFGIRLLGVKNNAFSGANKIVGNKFKNTYTSAIDIFYTQVDSVSNNDIKMRDGNNESVGINIYGALTDFIITGNKIVNAHNIGLSIDSCRTISRGLIANNMIAGGFVSDNIKNDCAFLLKSTGAFPNKGVNSSGFIDIVNNSILYDGKGDSASAFRILRSNGLNIFNNIFANYGKGYAIHYNTEDGSVTEFNDANTNLLYTRGLVLARWKDTLCTTLEMLGLQDAGNSPFNVGKSPNGLGVFDPLFRSNLDLHINNTKLNGFGTPNDLVVDDIDRDARNPSSPDIGCDEFFPGNDMSVDAILTPINLATFKNEVQVIVRVRNQGANITTVKVKYTFDGALVDSTIQNFAPSLKYDSTSLVIFNKKFSTRQAGPHILKAFTEIKKLDLSGKYINDDFNNLNDTTSITVISKDTSDIGVSYYLTPLNGLAISSKSIVKIGVTNYGNLEAKTFKVRLKVNEHNVEILNITTPLKGKETKEFQFNYQINPDSAVYFDVCATTILYDDVIEANDSNCITVLTINPVGIANTSSKALFSLYPNPTNSKLNYGIDLESTNNVTINVFDLSGRLMQTDHVDSVLKGRHILTFDYSTLSEGTYFFDVMIGDKKYNGRFVIIK